MGWFGNLIWSMPPSPPAELPTTAANTNDPAFAKDADDTHVISPDDVNQRNVGDCYLMSSLRALAQTNPDLLQRRISDDGQGGFNVRLYSDRDKCWYRYHVGRNELGNQWHGELQYTDSKGNVTKRQDPNLSQPGEEGDLWVRIFEVAYAKHLDAHDNSNANGMELLNRGGWPHDAMTALTGQPAEQMRFRFTLWGLDVKLPADNVGPKIQEALDLNRPVTMETPGTSDADEIGLGLHARHAYHVESVRREEGTGRWIVKLANPWGHSNPKSPALGVSGEIYLDDALNQGLLTHMDLGAPQPRNTTRLPQVADQLQRYPLAEHALAA